MAKKETSTDIAVAQNTALMAAPDFMDASDFGSGFEGTDKDSYAIPFLVILQKMSPMVDEDDPKYVPGAKAGMIYNTVTQKLYDGKEGLTIIPCAFKRSYVQWAGRGAEGGFKGEHTPEEVATLLANGTISEQEGRIMKPLSDGSFDKDKCDYYADTRAHYVLEVDEKTGEIGQAILAMSSSQIKPSRMLMTKLQQKKVDTPSGKRTPPTFANLVKFTTIGMSNDKGSWSGANFELAGLVTDKDLFQIAKDFYVSVNSGAAKADFSKADAATQGAEGAGGEAQSAEEF